MVTAADLADRVGGSLTDAENLSSKLGTALAIVALAAAFLIATLLTLSSVQKRIRELGTLKALGWRQRLVVRQVTGESLAQGLLGGFAGAAIGIAGAAIVDATGLTLEASVEEQPSAGSIQFEGQPLELLGDSALAELRLRAIGFVFQQFNPIPTLNAAENVEAALAPLAISRAERRETAHKHLPGLRRRTRRVAFGPSAGARGVLRRPSRRRRGALT